MAAQFRTAASTTPAPPSPERLFDELPRRRGAPDALWSHQADVLRTYHERHLRSTDVAIELPTGAGKTVPGLLIAEWRRKFNGHRVLYACPTHQLAKQVADTAQALGVRSEILIGSHKDWTTSQKSAYESHEAIGIVTYNTIFNAIPHLEPAQTLLFDDAHAGEQYVARAWSVDIVRRTDEALYLRTMDTLKSAFDGIAFQSLIDGADPTTSPVQLVGVQDVIRLAPELRALLSEIDKKESNYWRARTLGPRLDRCLVYVSSSAVLIRPLLPPTSTHPHFTSAEQRIYLSATLGEGGELERSFGRASITRLPIPDGWDSRGAGRRFFIFPELGYSAQRARVTVATIVAEAGKALTLSPSRFRARQLSDLAGGMPVLGPEGTVEDLISTFRTMDKAMLSLAGRYDGLDLPDDACRVTILDDLPTGAHLQERFLSETMLASKVLRERQRTRIIQGAGRCTRGLSDYSIVIVLGDKLTRFLTLPEVVDSLRPELQAEIQFGRDNSKVDEAELFEFVESFLAQDDAWTTGAEPDLRDRRRSATRETPGENDELATSAVREVQAIEALWSGDYELASQRIAEAAEMIVSKSLRGFRAFLLYLAATWLRAAAEAKGNTGLLSSADTLQRKAHAVGRNTAWLRRVDPLPLGQEVGDEVTEDAATRAAELKVLALSGGKWNELKQELLGRLSQTEANRYERGLVQLGELLGAVSYKPTGSGRTDAAWMWSDHLWIAVEAKSEEAPDAPVSLSDVRQANDQLKTLAHDRGTATPSDSVVLLVCPRQLVDPTAAVVAEDFLYLCSPERILEVANDALNAWGVIRAQASGMTTVEKISLTASTFDRFSITPSAVHQRLTRDPIRG